MHTASELEAKFGLADSLQFEAIPSGLVRARVSTPKADAIIYLQGAHIASWTPKEQRPVLFQSERTELAAGRPIRGGVPVIFPWFGARGDGKPGPQHGFARTTLWVLEHASLQDDGDLALELLLTPDEKSRGFGFDNFELRMRITIGAALHMELDTRNHGSEPLRISEALHSYFSISDVRGVSVTGLDQTTYLDHADQDRRKQQAGSIRLSGETDRVFIDTENACSIEDHALARRIVIEKSGSRSTVVWNPWLGKASLIADLGDDEWPHMLCVETANAADNVVTVAPGQSHRLSATIRLEPID